uniref:Uncharacterized protein n=1 Tax=Rhizophagus irregularis (strain DAOM 181602 / DAOM 197198 / MUCL 43194) TaxID=747089 RepID=U9U836_RHIID
MYVCKENENDKYRSDDHSMKWVKIILNNMKFMVESVAVLTVFHQYSFFESYQIK